MAVTINGTSGVTFPDGGVFTNALGSVAVSGYQKLPNGLILQWTNGAAVASTNQEQTVTFPITFPTATLRVFVTTQSNVAGLAECYYVSKTYTTSSVVVRTTYSGGSPNSVTPIVFAIGY